MSDLDTHIHIRNLPVLFEKLWGKYQSSWQTLQYKEAFGRRFAYISYISLYVSWMVREFCSTMVVLEQQHNAVPRQECQNTSSELVCDLKAEDTIDFIPNHDGEEQNRRFIGSYLQLTNIMVQRGLQLGWYY